MRKRQIDQRNQLNNTRPSSANKPATCTAKVVLPTPPLLKALRIIIISTEP